MAIGPFGVPISEETLIATGEYEKPITQKQLADFAFKMMNAGGKNDQAQQFVDELKESYGIGIATKCLIYNATGTTLEYVDYHYWHGHIHDKPPSDIQNGQFGAFLHVHPKLTGYGSTGAAVYRTKLPDDNSAKCDWLLAWNVPFRGSNQVFTQIGMQDSFHNWDAINHTRQEKGSLSFNDKRYGYVADADIAGGNTVNLFAVFQLPKE